MELSIQILYSNKKKQLHVFIKNIAMFGVIMLPVSLFAGWFACKNYDCVMPLFGFRNWGTSDNLIFSS